MNFNCLINIQEIFYDITVDTEILNFFKMLISFDI